MNEEKFRSLYRDTMAGLHAPARLGAAPARPPRRRPAVLAAGVAVRWPPVRRWRRAASPCAT